MAAVQRQRWRFAFYLGSESINFSRNTKLFSQGIEHSVGGILLSSQRIIIWCSRGHWIVNDRNNGLLENKKCSQSQIIQRTNISTDSIFLRFFDY